MGNNPPNGEAGRGDQDNNSFANKLQNFSAANFTQEFAEKLKITKSKPEVESKNKISRIAIKQQSSGAAAGNKRNQLPAKTQSAIQGIKIENDPLEREIYVKCPGCFCKVFDSGLENELECDYCSLQFVSGKKYTTQQIYQMQQQIQRRLQGQAEDQKDDEEEEDEEEEEELDEEEEEESSESDYEDMPGQQSPNQKEENKNHKPGVKPSVFYQVEHEEHKKGRKSVVVKPKDSPTQNPFLNEITPGGGQLQSPQKKSNRTSVINTPSKKLSNASPNVQNNRFSITNQSPTGDSSSKYINELEDVVLFCNIDTIITDFIDPQTKQAKLQLIQQQLLMPFFQLRTRILEKSSYFKIGGIEFYVAACEPYDFGKVASKTTLRCTQAVSKSDVIQRVNLVPLRRLDNSRTAIYETAIKPFLEEYPEFYVHKNQILEFDDYEFYVKYSRPLFGKIDINTTDIKIDSSTPKAVQVLRIAPIWNTDKDYEQANAKKQETFDYIKKTYLHPYFFCGFMCYVERGETLKIDDQEFFLNDCRPKYGIVDKQTIIELEVGFTQEVFKKKQVLADQRFAEKIQSRDPTTSSGMSASAIRQRVAMFGNNPFGRSASSGHESFQEIEEFIRLAASQGHDMIDLFEGNPDIPQVPQVQQENQEPDNHSQVEEHKRQNLRRVHSAEEGERHQQPSAASYNVDEYHMLLMLQQQAQLQQRYLNYQMKNQPQITPKAIVQALPERQITAEFLARQTSESPEDDEANKKCMVCIMEYEVGENVRTMPCLHTFHTDCIDKWLLQRACTCPICKFDIRRNYNLSVPLMEKSHSSTY